MKFEAEVRWIAEAVWGLEPGSCQPSYYPDDPVVREIDGIARLRDITHLVMVTTSTKLDKVKQDVKKLNSAERIERQNVAAVSKWLITQKQLDAQHIEHAKKNNVVVLTLEQFKQRFFDGRKYIAKREVASFGSARNPSDNSVTIRDDAYVPLPMMVIEKERLKGKSRTHFEERQSPIDVSGICKLVNNGAIVIMIAPFGAGKSLTTREVFRKFASDYRGSRSAKVPICLNLREHWGQEYFDEILERHARSIGFSPKEDLVIAWRSGIACILLDGFDELASQSIVRKDDVNFLREARRVALSGVRDFFTKLPSGMGAFICGRDHYFDNTEELCHALGISGRTYKLVRLDEFTEEGANEFLRKHGFDVSLPDWLPRKPLILSYLIQNELLEEIIGVDASQGYGYAWDTFIGKITQRESELERAVMDAHTLRNVMERLSFHVRTLASGNGPITGNDLSNAYTIETGQSAGEGVLAQLQRLPGLTQRNQEAGSRSFVDPDMLAALQGGALARYIWGQYNYSGSAPLTAISPKSVDVAVYLLMRDGASMSTVFAVLERLSKETKSQVNAQLMADCLAVSIAMSKLEETSLDCRGIVIESASYDTLDLEECSVRNLCFSSCLIDEVVLGKDVADNNISFRGCIINRVRGVVSKDGLPSGMFSDSCEILKFDDMGTNNAVLNSDLNPQVKALLTILRKLYKQSGAGRKISALSRGVTKQEVAQFIHPVLQVLEKHGFVRVYNQIVHPVRKQANRVESILNAPTIIEDKMVDEVNRL